MSHCQQGAASTNKKRKHFAKDERLISVFNHKGGVGKTTNSAMIAYGLLQAGKSSVCFDFDLQCSLSHSLLRPQIRDEENWDSFLERIGRIGLGSAIKDGQRNCIQQVAQTDMASLNLCLADHSLVWLDDQMSLNNVLFQMSNDVKAFYLRVSRFIRDVMRECKADYAILDLNPSMSHLNRFLLCLSDYLITPCGLDCLSESAIRTLVYRVPELILHDNSVGSPRWILQKVNSLSLPRDEIKFGNMRYLGVIINGYHVMNWEEDRAYATEEARVLRIHAWSNQLARALGGHGELARFSEFTSLNNKSQIVAVPVPLMNNALEAFARIVDPELPQGRTEQRRLARWRERLTALVDNILARNEDGREDSLPISMVVVDNSLPEDTRVVNSISARFSM